MKNLKMFAIAVMAFAVMAMGVSATHIPDPAYKRASKDCGDDGKPKCVAKIGENYYTNLSDAIGDAQDNNGGVITMLEDVSGTTVLASGSIIFGESAAYPIKTDTTIELGTHNITLGSHALYVNENGKLTITGSGEVTSTATTLVTVEKGGNFTTSGALALTTTGSSATLIEAKGKVVIGEGATLSADSKIVNVSDHAANVTLNAHVGSANTRSTAALISASNITAPTRESAPVATVTIDGGSYYTTAALANVNLGIKVVVNNGTFDVKGGATVNAFTVTDGSLDIVNGTITAEGRVVSIVKGNVNITGGTLTTTGTGKVAVVVDGGGSAVDSGKLNIKNAKIVAKDNYALSFLKGTVKPTIESGTFESKKDYPAIYIEDSLLTGMDGGNDDVFKGMLTGGKYLYMIIGGTEKAGTVNKHTAAEVAKYIIAEGLEEKTEGNYKILGVGATTPSDEPGEQPGTTEPGNQEGPTNQGGSDIPSNPNTNDNILVYAGLGLVSLASVAFTARKRED